MKFPSNEEYKNLSKNLSEPSPIFKNCILAFLIGGLICALGQGLIELYLSLGLKLELSSALCSVTLVFISAVLTGFGVYDDIAKHAGAGTLVPITGFANAVSSPAVEFKTEGLILGLGAKMFIVAGPVIVFGLISSVLYGIIYWIAGVI